MKTELADVSETQKSLTIEVSSDVVDTEINRVARRYGKQATGSWSAGRTGDND